MLEDFLKLLKVSQEEKKSKHSSALDLPDLIKNQHKTPILNWNMYKCA